MPRSGVKRQYMGCAGRVANGINTVHLSYVRETTGHALIGARQWIPAEDIADPVKSLVTGLPLDLRFRTKGQLAIDVLEDAYGDGLAFDFVCGDEVYGSCTELRQFLEDRGQAYVLRVASSFTFALAPGTRMTCADAVKKLLKGKQGWEVRSAGQGSKGGRWYAWAWIGTSSPRHSLLVRRHLKTGELAFHYCFVPEGQRASKARLIRAAGLRWPVEESFELGKGCFGLDQCQARPLHRGPAAPRAGHGRPRGLRRHRRPAAGPHRRPGTASCPARRQAARRPRAGPAVRPRDQAPARRRPQPARSPPATPPAGSSGDAATRHDHAGSTNAHAWHATTPWSASDWIIELRLDATASASGQLPDPCRRHWLPLRRRPSPAPGPRQRRSGPELPGHDDLPLRQRRHQQPQPGRRYVPAAPASRRWEAVTRAPGIGRPVVGSVSVR